MKKCTRFICIVSLCLLSVFVVPFNSLTVHAYVTASVEIPVSCLEISDSRTHIYKVMIEAENEVSPAPRNDSISVEQKGTGKFEIDINEPGTYEYRIYEIPGNEKDIKYDKNIYIVTVFVENAGEDGLKYAVSARISGSDVKPEQIVFKNGSSTDGDSDTASKPDNKPSSEDKEKVPFTGYIQGLLSGDSFRARALRITMICLALIAVSTLLFRRDKDRKGEKK